jgi:exodeoxyribonuclease V beta subunit
LPATLLRWFATQRREGTEDDVAQLRLESDQNLVQIVTVHSSKGLEYPVVFCPFMWTGGSLTRGGSPEGLVYHGDDGGTIIDFNDDPAHVKAVKEKIRIEQSAEELRLGYVALTRAVYRCYLVAGCYMKAGKTPSPTESTRSLLNWLVAGENVLPADWFNHKTDVASIRSKWQALAARCPEHISIGDLPIGRGNPVAPETVDGALLRAATLPAPPRAGWRMSSFSGLLHDAVSDIAATDHDARAIELPATASASAEITAADDILSFPRGASPGDCMHAVFEQIDFTDDSTWDEAIRQALAAHPQQLPGVPDDEQIPRQSRMLRGMLGHVLNSEIAPGVVLSRITRARRRTELAFHMPARHVHPERLTALLQQAGYKCPRLTFSELDGYLNGFIDLVFECDGKYYVLDWKSTHMGYRIDGYAPSSLATPMERNGYHLQYLIYTVALHRYLGLRVPGYSYDRHFGGALYLFVRGVRPDWRTPQGEPCGVYFNRPSADVIEQLDLMFAPQTETIAG